MSTINSTIIEGPDFPARLAEACGTDEPAKIARLIEVNYQSAKNYLKGRLPEPEVLIKIGRKTGYSIHWLLTGEGSKRITFVEGEATRLYVEMSDEERAVVERLAEQRGQSAPEAARDFLIAAVIASGTVFAVEDPDFNHVLVKTATAFLERNVRPAKGRKAKSAVKFRENR